METIVKQAVADAAQYLFVEHGVSAEGLHIAFPEDILTTAKECQLAREQGKRDAQLAMDEFLRSGTPNISIIAASIDTLVIQGPGGFIPRSAIITSKPRILDPVTVPRAALEVLAHEAANGTPEEIQEAITALLTYL